MKRPTIGLTLDHEPGGTKESGQYSAFPWYALRQNYADAVFLHGGAPLNLPHHAELANHYLDLLDGLIVTGGHFDIDPSLFGSGEKHATVTTKPGRTAFEWAIITGAIERKMPVLGICGGEQLLNVVLGGTLIQHVPDSIPNALEHEQKTPRDQTAHAVTVVAGSLLHRLTGSTHFEVNSSHHQAVATPGKGVVINAHAPDGVIEGIEYPAHPFCLGVEWHPEYRITPQDKAVMQGFVDAAGVYHGSK